ncbi:MAG: CYTH domain-containing protein [Elusimicrobia bacterium]|nr:CYTH domain-containing protein [Elusimicrobiota bacterium]
MGNGDDALIESICRRLEIDDHRFVEIEAKKRVLPEDAKDVEKYLLKRKKVIHQKGVFFFDQFLDTPRMEVFRKGASLRLRYRRNGTNVYLQYKGPGFKMKGLLFRSEFSTERLQGVTMEESHHDIVHFANTSVRKILANHAEPAMIRAMTRHLGAGVISRITECPILCMYQKEKFLVETGSAFLEPSLDRVFAFHIASGGLHPLSTFCEYENEVKAPGGNLDAKLDHIDDLVEFNDELAEKFDLRPEPLDKYHRCASFFLPRRRRAKR